MLLIVALLASGLWWIFGRDGARPSPEAIAKRNSQIAEVAPAVAHTNAPAPAKPRDPHEGMYQTRGGAWYPIGEPSLPFYTRRHAVVTNYSRRSSVAKTSVDKVLLKLFTKQPGEMPPVMPPLTAEQKRILASVLISQNPPTDEDSERVKLSKEILAEAKKAMRDYIKEGGDPQEFLNYYHRELKQSFQMRQDAQRMVRSLVKEGEDPELIHQMVERINQQFKEKNIKPLHEPRHD